MSESTSPQPQAVENLKKPHQHGEQVADYMNKRGYPEEAARDMVARDLWQERTRTERDAARERSLIDPLTGLYNRRWLLGNEQDPSAHDGALEARFEEAMRLDHPLAVLMVDMDFFKHVNDTFGHNAGDQVLQEVASRLKRGTRASDSVVRYGGEEFVVVMSFANNIQEGDESRLPPKSSILEVAERIRESFQNNPFMIDGTPHTMTSSIGAAMFDPHDESSQITTPLQLFKAADVAAYEAKEGGRNVMSLWTPDMGFEKVPHEPTQ